MTRFSEFAHTLAVVALVEKDALGVSGGKVDLAADTVFENGEGGCDFWAGEVVRGGLLVLVEVFPVKSFGLFGEFDKLAFEAGGEEVVVTGGEEESVGVAFEKEIRVAITLAIDEPDGVGVGRQQFFAKSEGGVEVRLRQRRTLLLQFAECWQGRSSLLIRLAMTTISSLL